MTSLIRLIYSSIMYYLSINRKSIMMQILTKPGIYCGYNRLAAGRDSGNGKVVRPAEKRVQPVSLRIGRDISAMMASLTLSLPVVMPWTALAMGISTSSLAARSTRAEAV